MKKRNIYIVLMMLSIALISFRSDWMSIKPSFRDTPDDLFSDDAPAAKTGAPNEGSCVDCHSGSTLSADGVVTFTFSGSNNIYTPGQSYDVTIAKTGSVKNGFQMTALDGNDNAAGDFTAGANSQIQTSGGRNYINHSASAGIDSWTFQWNAPSSGVGNVTFYYAFNETNNGFNNLGDQIYLGSTTVHEDGSSTVEEEEDMIVEMIYDDNQLLSSFYLSENANVYFSAQDLSGKQLDYHNYGVLNSGIQSLTIPLDAKYSSGLYLFTIFVDNKPYTTKIAIP